MPVKGVFGLANLEEYLAQIEAAGNDVDEAVAEGLAESAPIVTEEMHRLLRQSSETWTGMTDATIFQTEPQRDGNFTFVEIGIDAPLAPQGFYKEFGTARQAAEPFVRPAFTNMRNRWRAKLREVLKSLGVAA